jgi:integrase
MKLSDYTAQFCETVLPLKKRTSARTMRSHLTHILPALGATELTDLSYPAVQTFITALSQRLAPATVGSVWRTLSNILNRAEQEQLIVRVPHPDLPEKSYEDQRWLQLDEMKALIAAANPPYDLFFAVLAETGLRISEARAIMSDDIDFKNLTLNVHQQVGDCGKFTTLKTRNAYRRISLSRRLASLLSASHRLGAGQLLFATRVETPWSSIKALGAIRKTCQAVGIPPAGAHAFRRGISTIMGSILEVHPKIMAYRLGHGLQDITLGLYTRPVIGFDRECAERLGELLFKYPK